MRATNSAGSSASARTFASRPIAPSAATAPSRDAIPASESEFASVFRRWANAATTTRLTSGVGRRPGAAERDEGGLDVRPWPEDLAGDRVEPRALGRELDEHRDGAVRLRPRDCEEAIGDLALHHHAPAFELIEREALGDQRRGDVVRQVRDELVRRRLERRDVELQGVAPVDVDARNAREVRLEPPVDLDRVDVRDSLGEKAGEDAEPGPDFEHDVGGLRARRAARSRRGCCRRRGSAGRALFAGVTAHSPKTAVRVRVDLRRQLVGADRPRFGQGCERCAARTRARCAGREPPAARGTGCRSRRGAARPARAAPRRAARTRSCR